MLAIVLRPGLEPFCTYAHAAASSAGDGASQNGWLYVMAAPQYAMAHGIRFQDLPKLREGPVIPEVMEQPQGAIESRLHSGSAGRLHVRFPNTFGAVAVLGE